MIDIHAHILPGIDDGSPSMDESMLMIEQAEDDGISTIFATPHTNLVRGHENYWQPDLIETYEILKQNAANYGLTIEILPGMEIYCTEQVPDLIRDGLLIGLNHTNHYLIEFDFTSDVLWCTRMINRLRRMDVVPVIAHPERYDCIQNFPNAAPLWCEMGCELQLNRGSLFGKFGRSAWECATRLLDERLVTYIASDAHRSYLRTTRLKQAWDFLSEEYSSDLAEELLVINPGKLLKKEPDDNPVPEQ